MRLFGRKFRCTTFAPHSLVVMPTNKALILLLIASVLPGCVEQKDIEFFSDSGVILGKPLKTKEAEYLLPIAFKTRIMHSAQWLYDVEYSVEGNEVHITALYSVPPNGKKSIYNGSIVLEGIENGNYGVYYINTNKSKYYLGTIYIE